MMLAARAAISAAVCATWRALRGDFFSRLSGTDFTSASIVSFFVPFFTCACPSCVIGAGIRGHEQRQVKTVALFKSISLYSVGRQASNMEMSFVQNNGRYETTGGLDCEQIRWCGAKGLRRPGKVQLKIVLSVFFVYLSELLGRG
ncbi:hypothetical protein [uncultured Bradyrhizobium sp.]|uniref:hypothetical protein n=1 Tax=uncultured Bradyrhizobium sp. TaxID=199684 RepID=UPI0035CA0E4A